MEADPVESHSLPLPPPSFERSLLVSWGLQRLEILVNPKRVLGRLYSSVVLAEDTCMRQADWLQAEEAGSQLLTSGPVALHVKEEVGTWKACSGEPRSPHQVSLGI